MEKHTRLLLKLIKLSLAFFVAWSPLLAAYGGSEERPTLQSSTGIGFFTLEEFRSLAEEVAPKVNLFADVWKTNPEAEFFGGTSRDFLYWLRGKLSKGATPETKQKIMAELRSLEIIDIREFILYESDVDVVSDKPVTTNGARYGIKKIDRISANRFNFSTEEGRDELRQGYIPVEKIRLTRQGIKLINGFGDGVREIFESRPTVHFASDSDFESTHYAKQKLNHPILLALRYIRILAMDYFQTFGKEYPNRDLLLGRIDSESQRQVSEVVNKSLQFGALNEYLKNPLFMKWLNGTLQKAFRSYTNPTAARLLMEYFKAADLPRVYNGIEPVNQYLFVQYRDEARIADNLRKWRVDERKLFQDPKKFFPDGSLYHGTRTEQAFRSIVFQGILPSSGGAAGAGLYGVAQKDMDFSMSWGGSKDRLVRLKLAHQARVVDISEGYGKDLFQRFRESGTFQDPESEFATFFGIDVFKYPYSPQAFVVKNARVLSEVNGVFRVLMHFEDLRQKIRKGPAVNLPQLIQMINDNSLNESEVQVLLKEPRLAKVLVATSSRSLPDWLKIPELKGMIQNGLNIFVIPQLQAALEKEIRSWDIDELVRPPEWTALLQTQGHKMIFYEVWSRAALEWARNHYQNETPRPSLEEYVNSDRNFQLLMKTGINLLEVPVIRKTLLSELESWDIHRFAPPPKWLVQFSNSHPEHLMAFKKIRDQKIEAHVAGLTEEQLEDGIVEAHLKNLPDFWFGHLKRLAEIRGFTKDSMAFKNHSGIRSSTVSYNPSEGREIHGFFYSFQGSLWTPEVLSPRGYYKYLMALADMLLKGAHAKFDGRTIAGFLMRTMFQSVTNRESPEAKLVMEGLEKRHEIGPALYVSMKDLPPTWSEFDSFMERSLAYVGSGLASESEKESAQDGWVSNWLERAFQLGAERVSAAALIGAYIGLKSPGRVGGGTGKFLESFGEWDALIRFPHLREHPRGAEVIEAVVGHPNLDEQSPYVPKFRKHLKHVVDVIWKGHPRAAVWAEALKLPRNVKDKPRAAPRADFLIQHPANPDYDCKSVLGRLWAS